jgi:hypothetical protein
MSSLILIVTVFYCKERTEMREHNNSSCTHNLPLYGIVQGETPLPPIAVGTKCFT